MISSITATLAKRKKDEQTSNAGRSEYDEATGIAAWTGYLLVGIPVAAVLALVAHSAAQTTAAGWTAFGVGCAAIGGAAAIGSLLGFLFGIPRSLQGDKHGDRADGSGSDYQPNTNLEQISDWLTKILVGVGLVEIKQLGDPSRRLVGSVASGMGDTPAARVVAAALLSVFVVWGFLVSYLITRTQAARAFRESDVVRSITRQAVQQVKESLGQQVDDDVRLLSLVEQVLNPGVHATPVHQADLDEAMIAASGTARLQAFLQANRQRRTTWRTDTVRMGRTIPVFRALIASDVEKAYHRNHGQLGFALKDLEVPRWQDATDVLSEAIARRPGAGYILYEFNRAVCLAELTATGSAPAGAAKLIASDLNAVRAIPEFFDKLTAVPAVRRWIDEHRWKPSS